MDSPPSDPPSTTIHHQSTGGWSDSSGLRAEYQRVSIFDPGLPATVAHTRCAAVSFKTSDRTTVHRLRDPNITEAVPRRAAHSQPPQQSQEYMSVPSADSGYAYVIPSWHLPTLAWTPTHLKAGGRTANTHTSGRCLRRYRSGLSVSHMCVGGQYTEFASHKPTQCARSAHV